MEFIKTVLPFLVIWSFAGCFITAVIFFIGMAVVEFVSDMFGELFYNIGLLAGGPLMWLVLICGK